MKNDLYKLLYLTGAVAGIVFIRILVPAGVAPSPAHGVSETRELEIVSEIAKVNINTGSLADLMTLPGVGETTARNILAWRDSEGPFESDEELLQVKGIGPGKFKKLEPLISLN